MDLSIALISSDKNNVQVRLNEQVLYVVSLCCLEIPIGGQDKFSCGECGKHMAPNLTNTLFNRAIRIAEGSDIAAASFIAAWTNLLALGVRLDWS